MYSNRAFFSLRYISPRYVFHRHLLACAILVALGIALTSHAQDKKAANSETDVLVLNNGDTIHGKFVSEIAGKINFHSEALGDLTVGWDKVKEIHTTEPFAVFNDQDKQRSKTAARNLPKGALDVTDGAVTLHPENAPPTPAIPEKHAQYIMDAATLDKQINHEPGFMQGWDGAATAGATLVTATQNQYTVAGGIGLVRTVPTAPWLDPRNRSSLDFTGSFGKITQPGYTNPGPPPVAVAPVTTKTAIYHADAERDQYLSRKLFALAQVAFDHNFAQNLNLQQIYGGGLGFTAIKDPKQELDLKGTLQYEKQQFITGAASANQNLIGSTFSASYDLKLKLFTYMQGVAYIPAYNNVHAWSADETNSFAFPTYKNLSFSVGTLDSYLNDPPTSLPPTKRNSFQFTMGITYAIKSKY